MFEIRYSAWNGRLEPRMDPPRAQEPYLPMNDGTPRQEAERGKAQNAVVWGHSG